MGKLLTSRINELREAWSGLRGRHAQDGGRPWHDELILFDSHAYLLKVVGLERVLIQRSLRGVTTGTTQKSVAVKLRATFGSWDRKGQSCRVASDFLIRSTEPEQGTGR